MGFKKIVVLAALCTGLVSFLVSRLPSLDEQIHFVKKDVLNPTACNTHRWNIPVAVLSSGDRREYTLSTLKGLFTTGFRGDLYVILSSYHGVNRSEFQEYLKIRLIGSVRFTLLTAADDEEFMNQVTKGKGLAQKVGYLLALRAAKQSQQCAQCGILILEDDVTFCPYFWSLFVGTINSIHQVTTNFVFTAYAPYDGTPRWPKLIPYVAQYFDVQQYYGAQAVYYPAKIVDDFISFVYKEITVDPVGGFIDFTIKEFVGGKRSGHPPRNCSTNTTNTMESWCTIQCPLLLCTVNSLVQHAGILSTLNTPKHTANNFLRIYD
jgi:hypothetical protein